MTLENAATLGGLAIAGVTAVVAVVALKLSWDAQAQATAKGIYRDYLKLAFENPVLANPSLEHKGDLKRDERYRWFVAFMLNACDEIALSIRRNPAWRKVICEDLKFHRDYLLSPEFREDGGWTLYSCELKDIGEEAVR
jgi:hypothetical protein